MHDFYPLNEQISIYERNEKVKQVRSSVNSFSAEKDPEKQMKSYLNMLSVIEGFIVEEQKKEYIYFVVDRIIGNKIYDFIPEVSTSILAVIQTLRILPKLGDYSKKTPPPIILYLFGSSCYFSSQQKQLIQLSKNYFTKIFTLKDFSFQFENNYLLEKLWPTLKQSLEKEVQDYILQTIRLFKSKSTSFDESSFKKFVNLVEKQLIPPENAYFASKFICTLFLQFSTTIQDITTNFINCNVPMSLEILFKFLNVTQKSDIIRNLLEIDLYFFKWLDQVCFQNKELQNITFKLIIEYIYKSKSQSLIHNINQSFPFKHWFTDYRQPLASLTSTLQMISEYDPKEAKNLIEYLFKIMDSDYLKIFNLVYKLVNDKKVVSFKELQQYGYLQAFVIKAPSEILKDLFSSSNFEELTKEVFIRSNDLQSKSFKAMFNSKIKIEILSSFLKEVPSVENIKSILVDQNENIERACYIFCSIFEENAQVCDNFIIAGGLQWLEKLDESYFVNLLSCLVKQKSYKEVDNYISSLPKDHKIFSLQSSEIEKIVYGMNKMKLRPIRVPSLFYLLPAPSSIDPYNAYILGKSDYASNGYDCPLINQIGNRYIKPQYISMLLSRPYEIRRFCDNQYDHFPLFQFFTGIGTLRVQTDYSALSFWVKFHQTNNTSFFTTNCFKLLYDAKLTCIKTDKGNVLYNDIIQEKWNHIIVYLEHTFFGDKINLSINGKTTELNKISSPVLKYASFEYSGNGVLFIGSTIYVFKNYIDPKIIISKLRQKGPGFISSINKTNDIMITPYQELYLRNTEIVSFPSNCYPVPYFGFPFHFISQKRLSDLFIFLDNSRTKEQFDSIFHTLISINEITIRNTSIFLQRMVRSIKKNTPFIKDVYIQEAIRSVIGLKNDEWALSFILFDNELWKSVNNEILVDVLFNEFQNIDFSLIQEFELLMTNVVLQNPESKLIINIILQNGSRLQRLVKWIISFLGTAHCIDGIEGGNLEELISARCETKIQHTIIDSLKSFLKQDDSKYLLKNELSFDILCGYVTVSSKPLAAHFIDLITEIEKISPGYIDVSDIFILAIAPLASFKNVWDRIFELIKINNSKFVPLLISLIWATTISIINALSINDKCSFKIDDCYEKGLSICFDLIPILFQSKKAMFILISLFPLIFNFPVIYNSCGINNENQNQNQIQSHRLSSFSSDDLNFVNISSYNFIVKLVLSILSGFGIQPQKNLTIKNDFIIEWLSKSNFLLLLSKILLTSNSSNFANLFPSFILSFPIFNSSRGKIFIPALFDSFLSKIDKGFQYMKIVLDYSIFAICEKCFLNYEHQLLNQLFIAMKKSNLKDKNADQLFITMFIGLFNSCSHSTHKQLSQVLFANLNDFKNIIINSNSQLSIFYIIYLISKDRMFEYNMFVKNFSNQFTNPKDKLIFDCIEKNSLTSNSQKFNEIKESHRMKLEEFQKIYKSILNEMNNNNKTKFITEIKDLSTSMKNFQTKTNRQCCVVASDYIEKMKALESSFLLIEERLEWERFMTSIHDLAISESSFQPKCFHLSPRCLRFMVPQVLTPSPYPPFFDKKKNNNFSAPGIESSSSAISFLNSKFIPNKDNSTSSSNESLIYDSNSNFFKYFDAENIDSKEIIKDNDDIDDDIDPFNHSKMISANGKNILLDQTFTNEANVFVDQRKVSTYTQDLGLTSLSTSDMMDFFSKQKEKSNKISETPNKISKKSTKTNEMSILIDSQSIENDETTKNTTIENNKTTKNKTKENDETTKNTKIENDETTKNKTKENDETIKNIKTNDDDEEEEEEEDFDEEDNDDSKLISSLVFDKKRSGIIPNRKCVRFYSGTINKQMIQGDPYEDSSNVGLSNLVDYNVSSGMFTSNETQESQELTSTNSLLISSDVIQTPPKKDSKINNNNTNIPLKIASSTTKMQSYTPFTSDIIWMYKHHVKDLFSQSKPPNQSFLNLFKSVFGQKCHFFAECTIERHISQIPSIVFIYDDRLLILTYSTIKNNDIELTKIVDYKKLHVFLESVFLGHWGETKMFASHIVLNIPISSLLHVKLHKKTDDNQDSSFEFWSLTNGNFIIKVSLNYSKGFTEKLRKIIENVDSCLPKDLLLPNNSHLAIILNLNYKSGRSFVDMQSYPFFPSLNKKLSKREMKCQISSEFPNRVKTKEMLSSVLPFAYSSHHYCNEANYESVPANFYFTTEFLMNYPLSYGKMKNQKNTNLRIDNNNNNNFNSYKNRKNSLSKIKSVFDNQRLSKNLLSIDFSIALRKLIKLREGIRDSEFLNEWINHHFSDIINNISENINNNNNSNANTTTTNNNNNFFYANIRSSFSSNDINNIDSNNNNNIVNNNYSVIDFNIDQICQKLDVKLGSDSNIQFIQDNVKKFHLHSKAIRTNWTVEIQHENLLLAFCSSKGKIFQISDHYFAFASSINISNNGLFLLVDFVFGLTRIWRIKYLNSYPCNIEQISDFSWSSNPTSMISGTHFICATKLNTEVVLWEINGGTLHRILKFGTLITSIALDDEFGAIWITTLNHGYYYSLNGQRLADIDFENYDLKVTTMTVMPLNYAERNRVVICGCDDGKIFFAIPRIETRKIDVKILPSKHICQINRITVHPSRSCFLSTDVDGNVFIWSSSKDKIGLPINCYNECAICRKKPEKFCDSCKRAICSNCVGNKHTCILCQAQLIFVNL